MGKVSAQVWWPRRSIYICLAHQQSMCTNIVCTGIVRHNYMVAVVGTNRQDPYKPNMSTLGALKEGACGRPTKATVRGQRLLTIHHS